MLRSCARAQVTAIDAEAQTLTLEILGGSGTFTGVPINNVSCSWGPKPRPPPWNAVSEVTKRKVSEWVDKETTTSPCKKHIVRLWKRCKVYDQHPIHFYYGTKKQLFARFCLAHPDVKLSLASFKRLMPWYVRKGGRESCLCGCCENMKLLLKALNDARDDLHDALLHTMDRSGASCCEATNENTATTADTTGEGTANASRSTNDDRSHSKLCIIAAETSKSKLISALLCEDAISKAKCECVDGSCGECGFKQLWSHGLRPRVVDDISTTTAGKTHMESELKSGASDKWSKATKWSEHKAEREGTSNTTSNDADDDDEADSSSDSMRGSGTGSRVTDQRTYEAPLWQFLDHCEVVFSQYAKHRLTLSQQKASHLKCDRNYRPGTIISDIDFAENYDIIHALEIQSAHWSHKQLTLFISINSYLVAASFNADDGQLAHGTKVTVEPNGKGVVEGSYFATVVAGSGAAKDGAYEVMAPDDEGNPSRPVAVARKLLRHRDERTVAYVFATGDRKHDTHAVQMFLISMARWFGETTGEAFTRHFIRSDNAAQHFKSKYTLRFLTLYARLFKLKHVVWDFGCPGHGKGPWDGLGGTLKSWLRREAESLPIDQVHRGPEDCAAALRSHFESAEWAREHAAGSRYKINQMKKQWIAEGVFERPSHYLVNGASEVEYKTPRNQAEVAPLTGGASRYSFWVLGDEQLGMRRFTCWCPSCMHSNGNVSHAGGQCWRVAGCDSDFAYVHLPLRDTASVAATRAARHANGESLANSGLKKAANGTRFACATPRYGYDQAFELFETAAPARGKSPVLKLDKETEIGGIKFAKNRVIVFCRALERLAEDEDGRTFAVSSEVRAVEARMIRFVGVELRQSGPPMATNNDARARRALSGRAEPPPPPRVVITQEEESKMIRECRE